MAGSKGKRVALLMGVGVVVLLAFGAWIARDHIHFVWLFESLGMNSQGYAEYHHRQTGIVFVSLPGGTFMMGSRPGAEYRFSAWENPVHEVALSPFLLAKYEVSQAEWMKVMSSNPSHFKGDNLPVEQVSWEDCKEFCEKTGLKLPTEAQWEYGCRAGTTTPFAFGKTITTDQVNYDGNQPYGDGPKGKFREKTVSVDSFKPNDFGLYQMHGNVFEWCEDVFDGKFYSKPKASTQDPICTSGSEYRVLRGGSWSYDATDCRSAYRNRGLPSYRLDFVSLRPAWSP